MLVVYIASLNFEVGTSIVKSWKEEGGETKEFFIKDFTQAQPDTWYTYELWEASRK
jgi:hypothetical protein